MENAFYGFAAWLVLTMSVSARYTAINREPDFLLNTLLFPLILIARLVGWLIVGSDFSNFYKNVSTEEKQQKDKEFYETFNKHQKPEHQ